MNDGIAEATGQILFFMTSTSTNPRLNVYKVRQEIGMVFQQPSCSHVDLRKRHGGFGGEKDCQAVRPAGRREFKAGRLVGRS
ncbi:hypothetical protein [Limosilactobacillus fermentum]